MNKIIIIIFLDLADSIDMIFSTPFDGFLAKIGLDTSANYYFAACRWRNLNSSRHQSRVF